MKNIDLHDIPDKEVREWYQKSQQELDGLEYPPTHTYIIESMTPTGILKSRVDIIEHILEFYCQESELQQALEVGFNKGFLLHVLSNKFQVVDGCEPKGGFCDFVDSIKQEKLNNIGFLEKKTFKDLPWSEFHKYDCILLANCMHYIYREYGDFSFFNKIAYMCKGILIIEGFEDVSVDDIASNYARENWPQSMVAGYTQEKLQKAYLEHFDLEAILESTTGNARKFIVLRSKEIPILSKKSTEANASLLLTTQNKIVMKDGDTIYKWFQDNVSDKELDPSGQTLYKQFFFSRMSDYLVPIKCLIEDEGQIVGYGIKYIEGKCPQVNHLISILSDIEKDLFLKGIVLIDVAVVNFIDLKFIDYDYLSIQLMEDVLTDDRLVVRYGNRRTRLFSEYISRVMDSPKDMEKAKLW